MKNVQISCFKALKGEQWVGLRVRAKTNRKVSITASEINTVAAASVWCLGTVTKYCPKSATYLVVFDEPCLQPQWVMMQKGIVDVIVQIDEDSSDESLYMSPVMPKEVETLTSRRNRKDSTPKDENTLELVGMGAVSDTNVKEKLEEDTAEIIDSRSRLMVSSEIVEQTVTSADSAASHHDVCILCRQPTDTEEESIVLKCYDCGKSCHGYCFDPIKLVLKAVNDTSKTPFQTISIPISEKQPLPQHDVTDSSRKPTNLEESLTKSRNKRSKTKLSTSAEDSVVVTTKQIPIWRCWECIKCFHCKASVFNDDLILWSTRRSSNVAGTETSVQDTGDEKILLCGTCLYFYKHTQDYCIICNKLYAGIDVSSIPVANAEPTVAQAQDVNNCAIPNETAGPAVISPNSVIDKEEDMMIQCNECNHWIHALCEGIDAGQYTAITLGNHPIWGDEYLCPMCRVTLCNQMLEVLRQLDAPGIFLYPVTESVANNYFDVIRQPMDLATMQAKCDR